ncbi:exopolyphosphatase [Thalassotalea psychrophila]|uniref:Exopolyphosphatase n=1 Tax=Thalassotalea psychrophila TaxID=3065647 RepID=A0ABY9TPU4_9GAMM|nr:exopolyphosphatase [Colwelliaceae bacterium SQ149]
MINSLAKASQEQILGRAQKVAVVDLGSNSFHLVLARIVERDVQILLKEKLRVRLAQGLNDDLNLTEESIERGLQTLAIYAETLKGFHPDQVNIIATYTLRVANNAIEFINKAKSIIPYPIQVVSGQEEARLIYQGVAHSMHYQHNRLVIDIGGGSSELIIGNGFNTLALSSRNIGCVSLTKQYFGQGNIDNKCFKKALLAAEQELEPIVSQYKKISWQLTIGTSGTASALTEIALANNFCKGPLTVQALYDIKNAILKFEQFDDITLLGLAAERKHVIVGGLLIMLAIFELFEIDQLEYCDKALREGAIYEMEDHLQHDDIRERSITSLIKRVSVDQQHSERVAQICMQLLHNCQAGWSFAAIPETQLYLRWASVLYEVGIHINSTNYHQHSAYIVENASMLGFNQDEVILLTTLLRLHRKKIAKQFIPTLALFEHDYVIRLIFIFRLAVVFTQKRQENFLPAWTVSVNKNNVKLEFPQAWLIDKALFKANLDTEIKQMQKLGIKLSYKGV